MKTVLTAFVAILYLVSFQVYAQALTISDSINLGNTDSTGFWSGMGTFEGDVTYRIGGHVSEPTGDTELPFPISELKWPLSNLQAITGGGNIFLGENFEFVMFFAQSDFADSGKMKDSDWPYIHIPVDLLPDFKIIYSESDAKAKASSSDYSFRFWFDRDEDELLVSVYNLPTLGFGFGYMYQSFSWEASNVDQWYPLDPALPHDIVSGLVGTYSAVIEVPYIEIASKLNKANFSISGTLGYSPLATITDEDNHLLRYIIAKSRGQGTAFKGSVMTRLDISKHLFLNLFGNFLSIHTEGTADTLVYDGVDDGDTWTIDHKVDSTNYNLSVALGLRF